VLVIVRDGEIAFDTGSADPAEYAGTPHSR
jgi:hypothetical protein